MMENLRRMFLLVSVVLSLGCTKTYNSIFTFDVYIQIDGSRRIREVAGVEIWFLDKSHFVRRDGSKGLLVCNTDEGGSCRKKIEYFACATSRPLEWYRNELSVEDRFILLVVNQNSQVIGVIHFPKMNEMQFWGYEPLQLTGPIQEISPKEKRDLEARLHLLTSWQELHS